MFRNMLTGISPQSVILISVGLAFLWPCVNFATILPGCETSIGSPQSDAYLVATLVSLPTYIALCVFHRTVERTFDKHPTVVVIIASILGIASSALLACDIADMVSLPVVFILAILVGICTSILPVAWSFVVSFLPIRLIVPLIFLSLPISSLISLLLLPDIALVIHVAALALISVLSGVFFHAVAKKEQRQLGFADIDKKMIRSLPWGVIGLFAAIIFAAATVRGFALSETIRGSVIVEQVVSFVAGCVLITFLVPSLMEDQSGTSKDDFLPFGLPHVILLLVMGMLLIVLLESSLIGTGLIVSSLRIFEIFYWSLAFRVVRRWGISPVLAFSVARLVFKTLPILLTTFVIPATLRFAPNLEFSVFSTSTTQTASLVIAFLLMVLSVMMFDKKGITEPTPPLGTHKPFQNKCSALATKNGLTTRELEVMTLLAKGRTKPRIAEDLHLSLSTVQGYSKNIYTKLNVHSSQELIDAIEHTNPS